MNGKEIREKTNSNLKQIQLNGYHEKSSIHYTVHLKITITHHKYTAWIYSLFFVLFWSDKQHQMHCLHFNLSIFVFVIVVLCAVLCEAKTATSSSDKNRISS